MRWLALGETARRRAPIEIDLGDGRQLAGHAFGADGEPIDLLETARTIGEEPLPSFRRARRHAFFFPRRSVRLSRHIGQGIETVLRLQFDLVDGLIVVARLRRLKHAVRSHIAIGRPVKLGDIGFKGMSRELLHIDLHGRREALRTQRVVFHRAAIGIEQRRQAIFGAGLVGRHQRRRVLNGRRRAGEMGDPWLWSCDLPC